MIIFTLLIAALVVDAHKHHRHAHRRQEETAASLGSSFLPVHLHAHVKESRTFHELADRLHIRLKGQNERVLPTARSLNGRGGGGGGSGGGGGGEMRSIRLNGASVLGGGGAMRLQTTTPSQDDSNPAAAMLAALAHVRQGDDTCRLSSVCVPIPDNSNDPRIVIYPKCHEIMQCVGTCCDGAMSCHALDTERVNRTIVELHYAGHDEFELHRTVNVTMEQHRACSCHQCPKPSRACPPHKVIRSNCRCSCPNDGQPCPKNTERDPESCRCTCRSSQPCPDGENFDAHVCRCVPDDAKGDYVELLPASRYSSSTNYN